MDARVKPAHDDLREGLILGVWPSKPALASI
jgi:hypothetical protein